MKLLVSGCLHGEWDRLLDFVEENINDIDLVLVAGDVETFRTPEDLESFHAPPKYKVMGSFYKIYTGERRMPVPTIIIGGNHESSDVFHLLPFGGWVAENIFYTGYTSGLRVGNVSIVAESGIYFPKDYYRPHDEKYPIRGNDMISSIHIRAFQDFQILGLDSADIILTHDWPSGMALNYGGSFLQKVRKDLIESDRQNTFGLPRGMDILRKLNAKHWFAAHHHVAFGATVGGTSFYALPKPFNRKGLRLVQVSGEMGPIRYRGDWLGVLKATSELMANPRLLEGKNWDDLWKELAPNVPACDDADVLPFREDLRSYTTEFCEKFGIPCPYPLV